MASATTHLLPLTHEECLSLLRTQQVGRLAVQVGHYPEVFTVNYRLDGRVVVFRTNSGTKFDASNHQDVAFHVDSVDVTTGTGWSVLIQGTAEDVTDLASGSGLRSRDLGVEPWAPGERGRVVRVIPAHISGRRIAPGLDTFWSLKSGSYL